MKEKSEGGERGEGVKIVERLELRENDRRENWDSSDKMR